MMRVRAAAVTTLAACALIAGAQQIREFTEAMKRADTAMTALAKLENKTGPAAVRGAERLGAIYEDMIGFWRQRPDYEPRRAPGTPKGPGPVEWSEQGKAIAVALAAAANAGNAEKAAAAFKALQANCDTCHLATRVTRPGGRYGFKPQHEPR